ncbi:hypothetical protein NAF17_07420 [Mucilaginibacter sp. RB4R14]|uniref:hypothetical protein n=1 Tax=Mucilaginibacter aurantiaciroseus TaxID=2949308 RepID=UPI00209026DE|nr:hypothetical protein [Mucilaginibacter aurantiaciroseus]MCO5935365.1 hypothetical protein [Mucilaginibacter aurantiaciroseus]
MEKLSQEEAMQAVWEVSTRLFKVFLDQITEPKPPYITLVSTIKNLNAKDL